MRQAKLMLTGILILSLLAGTAAFKAKRAYSSNILTTTSGIVTTVGHCVVINFFRTVQVNAVLGNQPVYYTVASSASKDCWPNLVYTVANN